ncbi:hypothetical protein LRS10_19485 [Phenylobacterium sp. J426]|uniref:hypothetical protein n=1 Tax=Phenylobacterium sp. J426 TaxID=2898439 RepID=UPI0021508F3A|nr:hypothetical protein [Phenylobacterium sp. J426]MCR5876133.1 hypothetical protein [Phenylobacterium sp. J426]
MNRARKSEQRQETCEVIDFDEALLDSCPAEEKAELLGEARIIAKAFANEGGVEELEEMAQTLSCGFRDAEIERAHARKLSAALKRLAKDPWKDEP